MGHIEAFVENEMLIKFSKDYITIDGEKLSDKEIHAKHPEIEIVRDGQDIVMVEVHGVGRAEIKMDKLSLWIDPVYDGALCGLCGNKDSEPSNDANILLPAATQAHLWKTSTKPGCDWSKHLAEERTEFQVHPQPQYYKF